MARRWTDEEKRQIIDLWNQGVSATQIGIAHNCSRNSIIGLAHRIRRDGVPMRTFEDDKIARRKSREAKSPTILPEPKPEKPKSKQPAKSKKEALSLLRDPKEDENFAIQDQENGVPLVAHGDKACMWPVNDPKHGEEHLFCPRPRIYGRPYCKMHNEIGVKKR